MPTPISPSPNIAKNQKAKCLAILYSNLLENMKGIFCIAEIRNKNIAAGHFSNNLYQQVFLGD